MSTKVKMVVITIVIFILLCSLSFILLVKFYPPLNRKLFGGEIPIFMNDIQFWIEKVPKKDYYKIYARYSKCPIELPGYGHEIFFEDKINRGGIGIVFNPEDGRLYGKGVVSVTYDTKGNIIDVDLSTAHSREEEKKIMSYPTEWRLYSIGEGKIEGNIFKPIFPSGVKFTFIQGGSLELTSAPRYYIKIHFPDSLRKLQKEELEKDSIRKIIKEETRVRK